MKNILSRRRLILFLLVLVLGAPTTASAFARALPKRPCATALQVPDKPVAPTAISLADLGKSKFLKKAPVKDQGQYGCCWISSTLGEWERQAAAKFGKPIKLDENYMIMSSLFYRLEEAIYYGNEIYQGGWAETADWMATHIGLVPESACKWKLDLRDKFIGDEIIAYLNTEVANFQANLKALQKNGATEQEAWEFGQKKKKELLGYLRKRVGNFPSSFEIDGTRYTPNAFAKQFAAKDETWVRIKFEPKEPRFNPPGGVEADLITEKESVLGLYPDSWKRLPNAAKYFPEKKAPDARELLVFQLFGKSHIEEFGVKETSFTDIHSAIEESIDAGQPVFLGTFMVKEFYKNDSGIMSIAAFGKTIEEAKQAKNGGGHAVLITGVYKDANGKLLGYEIQNSWGEKAGTLGYYSMDLDYFETFMMDVVFHGKVKPKEILKNAQPLRKTPARGGGVKI